MSPASTTRLSFTEKAGYALGDVASNFFFQVSIYFLTFFYTDVFGLAPAAVGTMFLIVRIWDAINDPMMGAIADRTNSRWGKIPSVAPVGRSALRLLLRAHVHHARSLAGRETRLRLRHLHGHAHGLHRRQCPLLRPHGRHDR